MADNFKKCILMPFAQGFAVRYFLQTDVFKELQKKAKKIILLVPDTNDEFFNEYKTMDNVCVESYLIDQCKSFEENHKFERLLKKLRHFVLNSRYNIQTIDDVYKAYFIDNKDFYSTFKGKLRYLFTNTTVQLVRRSRTLRKLILKLEHKFYSPRIHSYVFDKYDIDTVLVSSLGTFDYDQYIMREATLNDVKVVTTVLSWDNTTTLGMPGANSDKVIAWTENMKQELIQLHDIKEENIFVGGVAHYDHYYREDTFLPREELCEKLGLDKDKKILFFVTKSPNGYPYNDYIASLILDSIRQGVLPKDCQLVVRMHPIYYRQNNGKNSFQYFLDKFDELKEKYPELVINVPQMLSGSFNYSMPKEEINLLASMLKHSDVVINMFSSLNIEASIFDRPLVNVCFEGEGHDGPQKARYNIFMDEVQTHNQRVIQSGGLVNVYNSEDMLKSIKEYLENPSKDKEGRMKIVKSEAGPFPGTAGSEIANYILSQ